MASMRDHWVFGMNTRTRMQASCTPKLKARLSDGLTDQQLRDVLDEALAEEDDVHHLQSFLAGLDSGNTEERIRAIWAVDALRGEPEMELLQRLADDLTEDADVRGQAEHSVVNMRGRLSQ